MNRELRQEIKDKIEWEGFQDAIEGWFQDVEDVKFKRLRGQYLDALETLRAYIYDQ